jgi:5-dehydro-2-deoxygluconokinase
VTQAVVLGRVGVDLTPDPPRTSLADATGFVRAIGGYGGNVSVGLARLGVGTALVSATGDDAHGELVRAELASEGIDVGGLMRRPGSQTQVAFFEAWPPETFPVTFHRDRPAPETFLSPAEVDSDLLASVPLVLVSGALLAEEPAQDVVLAALSGRRRRAGPAAITILDLDWRPTLWPDPASAPAVIAAALRLADIAIGSDDEFAAHRLDPAEARRLGPRIVALKHGSGGSTVMTDDGAETVEAIRVEVVCGLGAGDAFAAAFAAGILGGLDPATSLARGNAAGAIVASRLMCSSAMPTAAEIDALLVARGSAAEARA